MPEVLFPVLTGLTLVFAGILVGYFLWFRDRSEQLILSENLATENERLSAVLRTKTSHCLELEDQNSRFGLKNTSLEQLCNDLLSSREKVQLQASDLETELHSARNKLDQMREQLTEECRLRSRSEEQLLQSKQQYIDSLTEKEIHWKDQFAQTQTSLSRNENEVARLKVLNEQLAERLHAANSESAELKSELLAHREILETAKTNAAGLEKEYVSLESSMRSQIELLNESRGQTAAAISAKNLAEEALVQQRERIAQMQNQLQQFESAEQEMDGLRERCGHLESSLQTSNNRIELLVGQRDNALDQRNELDRELAGLRTRAENQQASIAKLRGQAMENDERRKQYNEGLLNQVRQLETANAELIAECGQLTQQVTDAEQRKQRDDETLKRVSEENAQLIASLQQLKDEEHESGLMADEYQKRVDSVLQQRDLAFDEMSELKSQIERLRSHAKSNEETIRNLRRERGAILMRNRGSTKSFPRIHNESLEYSKADQLTREYGGKITTDPVRGPLFTEAPRQHDDLKRIYGVAEILEEKLNEFGIYTFKQIMEWDDKAIDEFSDLLSFKDRIHRDDWLGQAARLYFDKNRGHAA